MYSARKTRLLDRIYLYAIHITVGSTLYYGATETVNKSHRGQNAQSLDFEESHLRIS